MFYSGQILRSAAEIVAAVESKEVLLDEAMEKIPSAARRSISHLVLTFFRRKKAVDRLIEQKVSRPPHPKVKALLQCALTQVFFQKGIAPESAVNVAVSEAKRYRADKFVNAILRRTMAEKVIFPEEPEDVLPDSILKRWRSREELSVLNRAFLDGGIFTFRLEKAWELEELQAEPLPSPAFRFFKGNGGEVLKSSPFRENHIYIQDPATSLVFQDLDLSQVKKALDLCAAPGGKTLMLAELLPEGAVITAADRSMNRQKMTRENLEKRGVKAHIITALPEELTGSYDLILADVPCSNTGVFRRRPDVLWNFSPAKIRELTGMQRDIMEHAAARVASGGRLIYSTCSIEPEENSRQVGDFLKRHPDFSLVSQRQLLPGPEIDGAFAAVMLRNSI